MPVLQLPVLDIVAHTQPNVSSDKYRLDDGVKHKARTSNLREEWQAL